jgi:hypothetical protein
MCTPNFRTAGVAEFPLCRVIPHNSFMSVREVPHRAFLRQVPSLIFCALMLLSQLSAKTRASVLGPGYVPALAAADHFLQAWQSGDIESGTALLSSHAKEAATTEDVEKFFSEPAAAYEIERGKLLKRGRYEFPIVLITGGTKEARPRRHFSSIIVVNTGKNDWAVDKLP